MKETPALTMRKVMHSPFRAFLQNYERSKKLSLKYNMFVFVLLSKWNSVQR